MEKGSLQYNISSNHPLCKLRHGNIHRTLEHSISLWISLAVDYPSVSYRCICSYRHDDGFLVSCGKCKEWKHGVCMDIDENTVPEAYECSACNPAAHHLEVETAMNTQKSFLKCYQKEREKGRVKTKREEKERGKQEKEGEAGAREKRKWKGEENKGQHANIRRKPHPEEKLLMPLLGWLVEDPFHTKLIEELDDIADEFD